MKAITIWQPWATLIIEGVKPYEFRSWPAHKSIIGQRIAIHAGARPVKMGEIDDLIMRITGTDRWTTGLHKGALDILERVKSGQATLPLSSVLGTAILGKPVHSDAITHEFGGPVNDSDRMEHSNYAWPMLEIQRLEPFVPAKGAQGFWDWKP